MKGNVLRWSLCLGLLGIAFYSLHGDNSMPDFVLDSVHLLKKPVEDLLPDLQEDNTTTAAVESATLDLEPYEDLHNERETWNEMRRLIEAGQPLFTPLPSEIELSTSPTGRLAPAIPPPPGFTVSLPYESRLTVSGRKTIGMTYTSTSNSSLAVSQGTPSTTSAFQLQQQLQVRINGQIGRKVTVNVDFDDTKTDKQDISIVYKGDPDEIVQRAAFGDITLSLPQTEFAGYSKQVFGAEAEMKYGPVKEYVIGSRTKGTTETKEFVGNVILQRLNIPDNSYVRHKYYYFPALQTPAQIDTGTVIVYLDTQDPTRSVITLSSATATGEFLGASGPGISTYTYTGNFVQLNNGIDYTIDPVLGFITFKNVLLSNYVVAINFRYVNQSTYFSNPASPPNAANPLALLKFNETDPSVNGAIPITEDLTHYSLGVTKIERDNGQGNFILQLLDLNNSLLGPSLSPPIIYLPNNAGQIYVDFEAGVFNLQHGVKLPFPSVYLPTPLHFSTFFVQFYSIVKSYTLRPNIVLNSEHITLDGRVLARDVDYFIDYESGFLTLFNPSQMTATSRLDCTYDYSPFGIAGAQQDTLVGERTELSLYPLAPIFGQSLIGSTVLYDFSAQQTAAPDIHQTAGSFLVTEADLHLKDLIFNPIPFLKSSFSAEGARSQRNPNTFGEALIDNMEGIKQATTVGLSEYNWQIARNPDGTSAFATAMGMQTLPNGTPGNLNNETDYTLSINPNAAALSGDRQLVLDISYDFTKSQEASIVTVLAPAGIDFSQKQFLEMYIQGDGTGNSGTQMNISIGQINEDADGTNGGGFTDLVNGVYTVEPLHNGAPRTEDLNHNGTLDTGEDIGWTYYNPDGTTAQIYANNLHLDSEDLDHNGVLDTVEVPVANIGFDSEDQVNQIINQPGASPTGSGPNTVDFSGFKFVRVPLEISSGTLAATQVKELRITLQGKPGAQGTIKIAEISIVGNKWLPYNAPAGSTVTATAVNTQDDANPPISYFSPSGVGDFDSLNQINTALSGPVPARRLETSLAINYALVPSTAASIGFSSATVVSILTNPDDLTEYGSIRFFVHSDGNPDTFIFRAGSDTDYWEFRAPLPTGPPQWREYYIQQVSSTGGSSSRPDTWQVDPRDPVGSQVFKVFGSSATTDTGPDLASVSQYIAGVMNTSNNTITGQVWFDELFVADVITRVGYAAALHSDFEIFGWGTFGAALHDNDQNFETFTTPITDQAKHRTDEYVNITRLSLFPMKFTAFQQRTDTPNVNEVGNTTLVSINQQGRVDEDNMTASGTLQIPKFPKLGLTYDTDKTKTADLDRVDQTTDYGTTLDYNPASKLFFVPHTISLGYKLTDYKLNFGSTAQNFNNITADGEDPYSVSNTQDITNDYKLKLGFQPWKAFTFNPNYELATTHEYKQAISSDPVTGAEIVTPMDYDKTKTENLGFDSVLSLRKWFAPRLRYNMNDVETYGIPLSTDPDAADFKTVDRTSTGELAWDFAWRDFTNKVRPLQSLNIVSSYLIQDGDSWNNVASGYDSLKLLTVRQPLDPGNPEATLQNLTLSNTFRSTQRWSPFDWATNWTGIKEPLRTMSLTSTITDTKQTQDTTGSASNITTHIYPDLIVSLTQTEYFFNAQNWMSNSQMNLKTQYKTVDTAGTSLEHASTNGGDWRFSLWKKLDLFVSYTRTTDVTFDEVNNVVSNDAVGTVYSLQASFNVGKWRITPKFDYSKQQATNAVGQLTTDLTKETPAIQAYADLFLPAGLRLPFGDLVVFSNRIRTTNTLSWTEQTSSLNTLTNDIDTWSFSTSEDYELTSNMRLTVGLTYSYTLNQVSSAANFYQYQFNTLLTIQF